MSESTDSANQTNSSQMSSSAQSSTPTSLTQEPSQSATTSTKKWYKNPWVWVGIAAAVIFIVAWPALFISGFFDKGTDHSDHDMADMKMTPTPTPTVAMSMTPTPSVTPTSPAETLKTWTSPDGDVSWSYPSSWTIKTVVAPDTAIPQVYTYAFLAGGKEIVRLGRAPFSAVGPMEDGAIPESDVRRITTGDMALVPYTSNNQGGWEAVFAVDAHSNAVTITIPNETVSDAAVKAALTSLTGLTSQVMPLESMIAD